MRLLMWLRRDRTVWVWVLAAAAAGWLLLLWQAPVWTTHPQRSDVSASIAGLTYVAGAFICHQIPERSWQRAGRSLPVCGRCSGLYLGGAIGLLIAAYRRPAFLRASQCRSLMAAAALPTLATVAVEFLNPVWVDNASRFVAAIPLGAVAGWLLGQAVRMSSPSALE